MLRKIEGKRRSGRQRIRWLDSITDSMDMSWSKLKEIVKEFMGVLQFMGSQRVGHGLVMEHCQQPPGSSHRIPPLKGSEVCGVLSGSRSNDDDNRRITPQTFSLFETEKSLKDGKLNFEVSKISGYIPQIENLIYGHSLT